MIRHLTFCSIAAAGILGSTFSCSSLQRKMLYFPTHRPDDNGLERWLNQGQLIGFARKVDAPRNVWLMIHGNGGQACDRAYALPGFSAADSVFILEYPGYGLRDGIPSRDSLNAAAKEAYLLLRKTYPQIPVCVAAESLGSGPGCTLAALNPPPAKIVLVVPFEKLSLVAKDHYPSMVVNFLMAEDWDNIAALAGYKGSVEIFGAAADTIIPVAHARALAAGVPAAKFHLIDGGHNDWSYPGRVTIRNP